MARPRPPCWTGENDGCAADESVHRRTLPDEAAVLAAYRDHFGITLDRAPSVASGHHPPRAAEEAPAGTVAGG